jgi:hypothetical protein
MSIKNPKESFIENMCGAYFEGAFIDSSCVRYAMEDLMEAVEKGSTKDEIIENLAKFAEQLHGENNV